MFSHPNVCDWVELPPWRPQVEPKPACQITAAPLKYPEWSFTLIYSPRGCLLIGWCPKMCRCLGLVVSRLKAISGPTCCFDWDQCVQTKFKHWVWFRWPSELSRVLTLIDQLVFTLVKLVKQGKILETTRQFYFWQWLDWISGLQGCLCCCRLTHILVLPHGLFIFAVFWGGFLCCCFWYFVNWKWSNWNITKDDKHPHGVQRQTW